MAEITLGGNPVHTGGTIPAPGSAAPDFTLTGRDLGPLTMSDFVGKKLLINIFPSLDTATCASSVRTFNAAAAELENTNVLCISADLPMAHGRFCAAEGIENVTTASIFRSPEFPESYGVSFLDSKMVGLCARAVVVVDETGAVLHSELVSEVGLEPNYEAAIAALG